MSLIATLSANKIPIPSLGFDTSEKLTADYYQFLAGKGYAWGCRYVPLSGQSPNACITPDELNDALARKLGMMFVQFARTGGWSTSVGYADGQTAAQYLLQTLKVPNTVSLWCDLGVTPNAQTAIDYLNAWYDGVVHAGMAASAPGVYMEPGVPLTAQDRYQKINLHRYWATAANDPNKMVAHRGCQLIQAWASNNGEFFPLPNLVIDGDFAQLDYFGDAPIAVYGT
jgi:hypothetical protein